MKKILIFTLVISVLFCFTSCSKDKDSSNKNNTVDVEYYAKLGKIPESEYSLHNDIDEIDTALTLKAEENEEFVYSKISGDKSAVMETGDKSYYYLVDDKESGVLYIVSSNGGYGFESGTVSIEIKEALSEYEYTEEKVDFDAPYSFNLNPNDCNILKYNFGRNTVIFAFSENALASVSIYDNEKWTLN